MTPRGESGGQCPGPGRVRGPSCNRALIFLNLTFYYFPAGAVAKYCNEYVCLCVSLRVWSVCLSASISPEPHVRPLPNFLCMLPIVVARSSSSRVTQSQGERAILGAFFPIDNALYLPCGGMNFATKDRFGLKKKNHSGKI